MEWNLTMLALHSAAFLMLIAVYRRAPDVWQKLVVGSLGAAMAFIAGCYMAIVFFEINALPLVVIGFVIEHLAILLYLIRIFISDQEKRCLPNYSQQSQRLPD